ncbi:MULTISPECIES: hypothetical protein [Novosphingobium]|uniref:hypothetical protein n=1 Tax=Novosphingobium TaxID=165696 RepID=UPI0022F253C5|nr:hypothetical protein [Novosphingobium resinovorum]GLK44981.1 hypothetical protein GCM10017612_29010 [Novosphingobium resinovorum]
MKTALPLARLFSVVPMALIVAPTRASGIFQLRLADAPPLARSERWRRFALLNWHRPLLLGLGAYIISAYLSECAPWMLLYALCIAGIPVAAYGPRRAGWALFAALAASLVYARVFMEN